MWPLLYEVRGLPYLELLSPLAYLYHRLYIQLYYPTLRSSVV